VLVDTPAVPLSEEHRALDARNAFLMTSLLQEVTRAGTAARAQANLKRPDIYGKTGTTNDAMDAWFAGYQATTTAITWIGYDTPRKLGDRETGGGLALPIWISYMATALRNVPVMEPDAPEGLVRLGNEWYYEEFTKGAGVNSVGNTGIKPERDNPAPAPAPVDPAAAPPLVVSPEEKKSIFDLFRN
jgi:penicillin-binding protein 1A